MIGHAAYRGSAISYVARFHVCRDAITQTRGELTDLCCWPVPGPCCVRYCVETALNRMVKVVIPMQKLVSLGERDRAGSFQSPLCRLDKMHTEYTCDGWSREPQRERSPPEKDLGMLVRVFWAHNSSGDWVYAPLLLCERRCPAAPMIQSPLVLSVAAREPQVLCLHSELRQRANRLGTLLSILSFDVANSVI